MKTIPFHCDQCNALAIKVGGKVSIAHEAGCPKEDWIFAYNEDTARYEPVDPSEEPEEAEEEKWESM